MPRLACVVVALCLPALAGAAEVQTVDLRTIECELVSIDADGVTIDTPAGRQTVARDDVSEIILTPDTYDPQADPMTRRGGWAVVTVGGDVLTASFHGVDGDVVSFHSPLIGTRDMDIAGISAIYMPADDQRADEIAAACREMEIDSGSSDRLLVSKAEGGYLPVHGALRSINNKPGGGPSKAQRTVTFTWENDDRKIPLDDVRAVLLADADADEAAPAGYVIAADGTTVAFASIELDGENVTIQSPACGELKLYRQHLAAIRFVSGRMVNLADLDPSAVTSKGMVTDALEYRRNLSVGGGPIRLDGATYTTGLGLDSFTELTYDINGEFSTFVAVVGIDDAVRPNGNAALTIWLDGQEPAIALALTGEGPGSVVRCDVTGVQRLTIRVDFGDDGLGVSDHVDLGGARLIR